MRLLDQLDEMAANEESMFRRFLAKEDAERVRKLCDLANTAPSVEEYLKKGLYIGWTRDDMRTWELKDQLTPLMQALYDAQHADDPARYEDEINRAWALFNQHRMKILVHCL